MKKWYWIVLAVLTYLLFLVAYTPARFITNIIETESQNTVAFSGVSGTLFNGEASALQSQGFTVNNFNWSLSPLLLLLLQVNADFSGGSIRDSEQVYMKGNAVLSLLNNKQIQLNQAQLFVPTKSLLSQFQLPVAISAFGRIRVDLTELQYENGCETLVGTGRWLSAGVNLNQQRVEFGNFEADLSCDAPNIVVQVKPSNIMELNAKIVVEPNGNFTPTGEYIVPETFPEELQIGASFFGNPKQNGRFEINF